ncbi:MAG: hypothetical protein AAGK37_11055 [Pseudomonadota bacterium]
MARPTTTMPNPRIKAPLFRGAIVRVADAASGIGNRQRGGTIDLPTASLVFQYNPEMVTYSRAGRWETRARRGGRLSSSQDVRSRSGSGSSHLLAESETISFKIVFDATEDIMAGEGAEGVKPEIAFLKNVSLGRPKRAGGSGQALQDTTPVRPDEVFVILEKERVFPAVLTGLTIIEQKFTPMMVPIRAEADLKFNVLEPVDVTYNTWVGRAFDTVMERRRTLSAKVEENSTVAKILNGQFGGASGPSDAGE